MLKISNLTAGYAYMRKDNIILYRPFVTGKGRSRIFWPFFHQVWDDFFLDRLVDSDFFQFTRVCKENLFAHLGEGHDDAFRYKKMFIKKFYSDFKLILATNSYQKSSNLQKQFRNPDTLQDTVLHQHYTNFNKTRSRFCVEDELVLQGDFISR